MRPGIARHDEEWARFWRRLSAVTATASVLFALPFLWLLRSPAARDALNDPKRFGFAGPEQYVRRIQLTVLGAPRGSKNDSRMVRSDALAVQRRGGAALPTLSDAGMTPAPAPRPFRAPGTGDSEEDILARAMLRAGDTPLFQSRELVVVELVEPLYPSEARERGIEGRVAIMALVDTTGSVRQAEIVGSADRVLERAAMDAVMQCRFEPYAANGRVQEVYAMFRFVFRLIN